MVTNTITVRINQTVTIAVHKWVVWISASSSICCIGVVVASVIVLTTNNLHLITNTIAISIVQAVAITIDVVSSLVGA